MMSSEFAGCVMQKIRSPSGGIAAKYCKKGSEITILGYTILSYMTTMQFILFTCIRSIARAAGIVSQEKIPSIPILQVP